MKSDKNREKWLVVAASSFIAFYCVTVLGYVVSSPDIRLRFLLVDSDEERGRPAGIIIRSTPGLEYSGPRRPHDGDVLLKIGDRRIHSFLDFSKSLSELRDAPIPPGAKLHPGADPSEKLPHDVLCEVGDGPRFVKIEYRTPGNEPEDSWVLLQSLPVGEVALSFVWLLLQSGIFIVSSLAVWHRPFDRQARLFFAMCVVTLGAFVGGYHWWVIAGSPWLNVPFAVCAMLVPVVSLHFFLVYPRPMPPLQRWPRISLAAIYAIPMVSIGAILSVIFYHEWLMTTLDIPGNVDRIVDSLGRLQSGIYLYLDIAAVCFALMLGALAYGYHTTKHPIQRSQMRWMFVAGLLSVIPIGYSLIVAYFYRVDFALGEARIPMFLASLFFMLAYAMGIARYKLMLVDQIVTKGMKYYFVTFLLTVGYSVVIAVTSLIANFLNRGFPPQQALQQATWVAAILVLVIVVLLWLRDRVQQSVDRRFFRQKYQLDKALQRMHRAVGHLVDRQSLAQRLLVSCQDVLRVDYAAYYTRGSDRQAFQLVAAEGAAEIPLQFMADETVLEILEQDGTLQRAGSGLRGGSPVQETLRILHADLIFALESDGGIAGLIVLGSKKSGAAYTAEDLTFLNALGQITRVSLHTVKVHQDLARLNEDLKLKVDKISEQKRQIAMMQSELNQRELPADDTPETEFRREPIKGSSSAIRQVLDTVRKVSTSESSVLIRGESGTGKELLAQAIHENSPRSSGPMIRVHCAALSPSLLESELFGHVKGAFTGAHRDRVGRFEMANGGTLFLDEIGDISLETQIKLLRVLQERAFEPVGGTRTVEVDVRLITATHQNLEKLITQGQFREDLYYRLNVISITLPSLRERHEDIFELALHFLKRSAKRLSKRISQIDDEAVAALSRYSWPGNIRELENALERAVVLAEGNAITVNDLPEEIVTATATPAQLAPVEQAPHLYQMSAASVKSPPEDPSTILADSNELYHSDSIPLAEPTLLRNALRECGGNKAKAARMLGMPRSTFFSKLKKYSIT